jgi:hypothetical protein
LKFSGIFDDRGWFEALKGRFIPIFSDDSLVFGFIKADRSIRRKRQGTPAYRPKPSRDAVTGKIDI